MWPYKKSIGIFVFSSRFSRTGFVFLPSRNERRFRGLIYDDLCMTSSAAAPLFLPVLVQKCYEHCMDKGAEYMATQWARECFCSDNKDLEYDRHGSGAVCDMACTGEKVNYTKQQRSESGGDCGVPSV